MRGGTVGRRDSTPPTPPCVPQSRAEARTDAQLLTIIPPCSYVHHVARRTRHPTADESSPRGRTKSKTEVGTLR